MAREDVVSGKTKQAKGKYNEVAGATKGKTSQEAKGKLQKGMGKIQEKFGKKTS